MWLTLVLSFFLLIHLTHVQVVQTCRNLRQVRGAELVLTVRPNGEFRVKCSHL